MRAHSLAVLALCVFPSSALAQSRPDFSGEWTRVDSVAEQRSVAAVGDAGFRTGTMGSVWGTPLTIRQHDNQLIVEYVHFATYDLQPRIRFVYALDGTESRNTVMIGHAALSLRSRAMWAGDSLIILTFYPAPGQPRETTVRQAIALESPTSLVIEIQHTGVTAGASTTTRSSYTKR